MIIFLLFFDFDVSLKECGRVGSKLSASLSLGSLLLPWQLAPSLLPLTFMMSYFYSYFHLALSRHKYHIFPYIIAKSASFPFHGFYFTFKTSQRSNTVAIYTTPFWNWIWKESNIPGAIAFTLMP